MTGEKDRFTTTEKLWKLDDKELSTPKHDTLTLQLLNPENTIPFIECVGYSRFMHFTMKSHDDQKRILAEVEKDGLGKLSAILNIENYTCSNKWGCPQNLSNMPYIDIWYEFPFNYTVNSEVPITAKNGFIVGYFDIQMRVPVDNYWELTGVKTRKTIEIRATRSAKNSQLGDYEIEVLCDFKYKWRVDTLNVEVKPVINSFGETLRQLNTYRNYKPNEVFVIYSPDTRFKKAFESQGIIFVSPADIGL